MIISLKDRLDLFLLTFQMVDEQPEYKPHPSPELWYASELWEWFQYAITLDLNTQKLLSGNPMGRAK